jgi:hypothetical protein
MASTLQVLSSTGVDLSARQADQVHEQDELGTSCLEGQDMR